MSRKAILIRGPQGAGKTTMINRLGLQGHNISLDKIRDVVAGDVLNAEGQFIPSHDHAPLVYKLFIDSIERRISTGDIVTVDATMANGNDVYQLWQKFRAGGYQTTVVDLWEFDDALRFERNAARSERQRVPESSVERMRAIYKTTPIPPSMRDDPTVSIVMARNDADVDRIVEAIPSFLRDDRCYRDLSAYRKVVHVGDLQGTFDPLIDPRSPFHGGLKEDTFYVFLGDLFDRGKQNHLVAKWFIENALGKPNVALIAGNHEDYVDNFARDIPNSEVSEWTLRTLPQLMEAGVRKSDIRRISAFAQDFLLYEWKGVKALCSHAGFARMPSNLDLVSGRQMRVGTGGFGMNVDEQWTQNEAESGIYQIHGHRNSDLIPTMKHDLSFNLEAQVEFGGHMRFLTLDKNGFTPTDIRSTVFRTMVEDMNLNKEIGRTSSSRFPPTIEWSSESRLRLSDEVMGQLQNHEMVNIKPMRDLDGLLAVNFTRDAFQKAAWDDYTTVARGLFIDGEDNRIVARSYVKSFTHGERPETTGEGLLESVSWPIRAYEKLNGFLCITGYSERHQQLIVASKSSTTGPFAEMAQEILRDNIGDAGMELMARINRDQNCSLLFEIEDPVRDPHIIQMDKPRAVLLACVCRTETFEQASYDVLKKIGEHIGCTVKDAVATIPSPAALKAFMYKVEKDPNWTYKGRQIEGLMLESDNGHIFKLKTHFYKNWKYMRSAVNMIRNAKVAGKEPNFARYDHVDPQFKDFMAWANTLSTKALEKDIITLRNGFLGNRAEIEAIPEDPEIAGRQAQIQERFDSKIKAIAENDRIPAASIQELIDKIEKIPEQKALFETSPYAEMLLARLAPSDDYSMEP